MNAVVCTLFEKNYHFGVAALINSIYAKGFTGDIYVGYKGELPNWAKKKYNNSSLNWTGAETLKIAHNCYVHFLPLETDYHLTNYKPHFIKNLFEGPAKSADHIFYFDPDIVNIAPWHFYPKWAKFGIALVHEIALLDMPINHPVRHLWREVIKKSGLKENDKKLNSYFNAGFIGISKENQSFLNTWIQIFETGKEHFGLKNNQWNHDWDRTYPFQAQDQDALNIATMCTQLPLSEMGPEAMGFIPAGWIMYHATGGEKPWKTNFSKNFLKGRKIPQVHKFYWEFAKTGIIQPYKKHELSKKNFLIKMFSFLNRFYGH